MIRPATSEDYDKLTRIAHAAETQIRSWRREERRLPVPEIDLEKEVRP